MDPEKIYFSWQAEEFQKTEKSPAWFFILTAAGLIFFVLALIIKNYLLALIIAVSVFLIYSQSQKNPRQITFEISEKGVNFDGKFLEWEDFESFWIFENHSPVLLGLNYKKSWRPKIIIPLKENLKTEEIKNVLERFLLQKEQKESLADILGEKNRILKRAHSSTDRAQACGA